MQAFIRVVGLGVIVLVRVVGLVIFMLVTYILLGAVRLFLLNYFFDGIYLDIPNTSLLGKIFFEFIGIATLFLLFLLGGIFLKGFKFYTIRWAIFFALLSTFFALTQIEYITYAESTILTIVGYMDYLMPAIGVYIGWILGNKDKFRMINRPSVIRVVCLVALVMITYLVHTYVFRLLVSWWIHYTYILNISMQETILFEFPAMISLFLPFLLSGTMLKRFQFYSIRWAIFFAVVSTIAILAIVRYLVEVDSIATTVIISMKYLMPALGVYIGWLLGNKLGWRYKWPLN